MILFLICLLFRFFIERLKFFVNSLNAKLLVFFGNNDGSNTSKYSAQCHVSTSWIILFFMSSYCSTRHNDNTLIFCDMQNSLAHFLFLY